MIRTDNLSFSVCDWVFIIYLWWPAGAGWRLFPIQRFTWCVWKCNSQWTAHTPLPFLESLCSFSLSCFSPPGDSGMSSSMASSDSQAWNTHTWIRDKTGYKNVFLLHLWTLRESTTSETKLTHFLIFKNGVHHQYFYCDTSCSCFLN